jgi:hypothetical protein
VRCPHTIVEKLGTVEWCPRCGSVCMPSDQWRLSEYEQDVARQADLCPVCEFGDPLPVDVDGGRFVQRWTCGHWLEQMTREERLNRGETS